jgi:hypothetical protein
MIEITARLEDLEETLRQIEKLIADTPTNYKNSATCKQLKNRAAQIRQKLIP